MVSASRRLDGPRVTKSEVRRSSGDTRPHRDGGAVAVERRCASSEVAEVSGARTRGEVAHEVGVVVDIAGSVAAQAMKLSLIHI